MKQENKEQRTQPNTIADADQIATLYQHMTNKAFVQSKLNNNLRALQQTQNLLLGSSTSPTFPSTLLEKINHILRVAYHTQNSNTTLSRASQAAAANLQALQSILNHKEFQQYL